MYKLLTLSCFLLFFQLACEGSYKKSFFGNISYDGKKIKVHDKSSFEILEDNKFARDKVRAYFRGSEIPKSHGKTFEVIGNGYAKDKNKVYFCDAYRDGTSYYTRKRQDILIFKGEDPEKFKLTKDNYAYGNKYVYYYGRKLSRSHGTSFQNLGSGFAKDKNNVYYHGLPMYAAQASSFEIVSGMFAKDSRNVYWSNKKLENADPDSFIILKGNISRDKNHIFNVTKIVKGIDAKTYQFFPGADSGDYAKDKKYIYWETKRIVKADRKTFKVKNNVRGAYDKYREYDMGRVVKKY